MVADGFALWELCVCVKEGGRGRETVSNPRGPNSKAKLPMQRGSSGGFKQAPACNMDETGAPCRTVRGPRASLDLTVCLSMCL